MLRLGHSLSYYLFRYKHLKSSVFNLGYRCLIQSKRPLNQSRRCYWLKVMNNILVLEDCVRILSDVLIKQKTVLFIHGNTIFNVKWATKLKFQTMPISVLLYEEICGLKVYNYILSQQIGVQLRFRTSN